MFHANENQKKAGIAMLIPDKTDFNTDYNEARALHNDKRVNATEGYNLGLTF